MEALNQRIIIDSCILVYCGDEVYGEEARKLLRKLSDNKNKLGISELSGYEVLKHCKDDKTKKYYLSLLNYLVNVPLTPGDINNAAVLANDYGETKVLVEDKDKDKPHAIDHLIGGTAIRNGKALVLTANRKHFPHPFWKVIDHKAIIGTKYKFVGKNVSEPCTRIVNVYLLEFNLEFVEDRNKKQLAGKKKELK